MIPLFIGIHLTAASFFLHYGWNGVALWNFGMFLVWLNAINKQDKE